MNSSLLVPAFVVVALAAMGAVFFGDMFSGGAGTPHGDHAAHQTELNHPSDVSNDAEASNATEDMAREFTWDDDDSSSNDRESIDTAASKAESFVSASSSDDAPGEVFSTSKDNDAFDVSDTAKDSNSSMGDFATGSDDDLKSQEDVKAVSKQVDSDLDSFFNFPKKSNADVVESSTTSKPAKTEFVSSPVSSDPMAKTEEASMMDFGTQLAAATPKKKEPSFEAFPGGSSEPDTEVVHNEFATEPTSSKAKSTDSKMVKLQSVVSQTPSETDQGSTASPMQADADDVISGNLEPVVDSAAKQMGSTSSKTVVRKFKITNPKETTLPVTMSVDGEKITLKPDQTYVIREHDGEVTVTFSRGGSFGFENRTLKNGHYRFSVTREAGWKLNN